MKDLILESSLLPILESALRSCSLLEITKEMDLYNSYLDIISEMALNPALRFTMQNISSEYEPQQKESISLLLSKLADLSNIFVTCLRTGDTSSSPMDDQSKKSKEMAERIILTNNIVQN